MRRSSMLITLLAATAVLLLAVESLAVFTAPDSTATFKMQQGWWNGKMVWFIMTETSDIRFSQAYKFPGTTYPDGLTLDFKLSSALFSPGTARAMGIVVNPGTPQGPIFENAPAPTDAPDYSGLWAVYYVKWRARVTKVPLKSWADVTSRLGTQLDYSNVYGRTAIDPRIPFTIVDAPIVAVGALGGPWWPAPTGDPDNYRIKQGSAAWNYCKTKMLALPTWYVFSTDWITKRVKIVRCIIPDVYDPDATQNPPDPGTLADILGANWAPNLVGMPDPGTQLFYVFLLSQSPAFQYPVIEQFPCASAWGRTPVNAFSWRNLNRDYSAIMREIELTKTDTSIYNTLITNKAYIDVLIGSLKLDDAATGVVFNAPVVPPVLNYP